MNKNIVVTENLAYKILMFFTRHLGFQSFRVHSIENHTWRLEFYNSSNRAGVLRISNYVSSIRFDKHKPTCKDIVNELLMFASKGERIASLTSNYHSMTLMRPFTTIEELLMKMDLELYER